MAATLKAVAAVAKRIMNLEKERCLLNAIRLAKNVASCIVRAVKIIIVNGELVYKKILGVGLR